MAKKYPIRHENHTLEEKSIIFFRRHLPASWNVNSIDRDYGQDLNIEITENGSLRGLEFIVQLKSSHEPNNSGAEERQTFRVSTYNYLWDNLRVVLLVKFVESEDEAYWILLKDVPQPNQENDSFTIRIPRENILSKINWNEIVDYIRDITNGKLDAIRRNR
ncbi:DUF4365 domain-containing protein [Sphingobacterium spiritivorum]|uniref:DUF4365 domain-containing protein n=1 Tax=Sphingobacterium spiritivorum TaxID=258 RepID=UPI001919B96F|nr:DUF4365 domain-containing protein [Sphingobacterium spiritivorum]QQT25577.1 DUF4365 domain-containing protein [Sphingobacterium spiritivorum]